MVTRFLDVGECGLAVELGNAIDEEVNTRVHLLAEAVRRVLPGKVQEVVPTYRSLLLFFDPFRIRRGALVRRVARLVEALPASPLQAARPRVVRVPVGYGGEHGPDLAYVAHHAGLTEEEVVAIHASVDCRVYMLGFTPGFPYLGGMSARIATPRLDSPRARIPAGTVGIAGAQTGIYPIESPGGWRLIGRTPLRLFDPRSRSPFLLAAGYRVRFEPVDDSRWREIERQVAEGTWRPELVERGGVSR
jgi:inhibitor of KinA